MLSISAPRLRIAQALYPRSRVTASTTSYRAFSKMSETYSFSNIFRTEPVYRHPSRTSSKFLRAFTSRAGPDPWQSHDSAMRAVWAIIGLNAAVFGAWQLALAKRDSKLLQQLRNNTLCSTENMRSGRYYTLITSALSHQEPMHFGFNMISFYAFGSIMSWIPGIGAVHVISLSIGSAVAGSLSWLYHQQTKNPQSQDRRWGPNAQHVSQIMSAAQGASGMVMGAAAAATCLMPFAPMNLMFIPIPIPLWIVTSLYAAVDIWYLDSGSRIGHSAHLGGSIYGVLYYLAYLRGHGGVWKMIARRLGR